MSATKAGEENAALWYSGSEFDHKVAIEVICDRKVFSGAGGDRRRFSHLPSIINTDIGGRSSVGR